jgi:hypothetical protein
MTSVTAGNRRVLRLTYALGDTDTYTVPYSEYFTRAVVQVLAGNIAGDTVSLYGSLTPAVAATHFLLGEDVTGTVNAAPQLTGPGVLFYTKDLAIPLVLAITVKAAPGNAMVLAIQMYNDIYQGSKTRSL